MQKIKPSPEINSTIISLYASGLDTYQVAERCRCSQTFVMNTLKRCGVQRRTTQSYTTKYISNEKFFDLIDTENKAYVLGFFYADGNNYIRGMHSYEISIVLQEEDKFILEKMRDFLCPSTELTFGNRSSSARKNTYSLKINSKLLSQQLTKLGCVPAKSLILTWPTWLVDPKLQQHFIRGYFDGDGSLYAKKPTKTGQIDWGWQITSTGQFCLAIKELLKNELNIHCSIGLAHPKTNQITTTLSVGGNLQVKKVLDWMYQGATIYLPRKYEKYLELIS